MPKVKLSSTTKIKAIRKHFEEFTATPNEELYCQVCCCIVEHKKRFLLNSVYSSREAPEKHWKKIYILFGHIKSYFQDF